MLTTIFTADISGINAYLISVEVDSQVGIPGFHMVGLASTAVSEGKIRVKSALDNCGFSLKSKKITVNLAPGEVKKDTTAFDLPIALGVISVNDNLPSENLEKGIFVGELSLDGTIRPVRGVLAITEMAKNLGFKYIVVPQKNVDEAALVDGIEVRCGFDLLQVVLCLKGKIDWKIIPYSPSELIPDEFLDLKDVRGQKQARRTLEIAAAGGHNLLFAGPPGSGKSMLARRLPSILPPLTLEETLESTKIYSIAGQLREIQLLTSRPFRSPHHTITNAGLVGGGPGPRPGEISLAHNGVLFLDELLEFSRNTLETLRQPLEDKIITITRARGSLTFPSGFQLVGAMNPCPCGHYGDPARECICSIKGIKYYRSRLSGPLRDRFDIQIEVPALSYSEVMREHDGESSKTVRERVIRAREIQSQRLKNTTARHNSEMSGSMIREFCTIDDKSRSFMEKLIESKGFSVRAADKILKVARTIADLDGEQEIRIEHLKEAGNYRYLDNEI